MNRLGKTNTPYNQSHFYLYFTNLSDPIEYNGRRYSSCVNRIEINKNTLYNILESFSRCNPTNYEDYKEFIYNWKIVYKKVTETIRSFKKWHKEYARNNLTYYRCIPPINEMKRFANALLAVRQQMKMLNKYYMVNHDRTNDR